MIPLARKTLVYEWRRYLPALMSIAFSGVLLLVQSALVYGIFGASAVAITQSSADLWVGYEGTESFDLGRKIPKDTDSKVMMNRDVDRVEPLFWTSGDWLTPNSNKAVSVLVSGIDPSIKGMAFDHLLTPELRQHLYEFGSIIVDRNDLEKLGLTANSHGILNQRRVHLVGTTEGLGGLGGVNILTSIQTARWLSGEPHGANGVTYLLLRLGGNELSSSKAATDLRIQLGPRLDVWTNQRFAKMTMLYWLFDTGAGLGIIFLTLIVIVVGIAITSQTLIATVAHSLREFATLMALGVGFKNLRKIVLEQSAWLGGIGMGIAAIIGTGILSVARHQGVPVQLSPSLVLTLMTVVMIITLTSGLLAVRTLRNADPSTLLR